jgi:hypothetical protein
MWNEALEAAYAISDEDETIRSRALAVLAPRLPQEMQITVWPEALAAARAIRASMNIAATRRKVAIYCPSQ